MGASSLSMVRSPSRTSSSRCRGVAVFICHCSCIVANYFVLLPLARRPALRMLSSLALSKLLCKSRVASAKRVCIFDSIHFVRFSTLLVATSQLVSTSSSSSSATAHSEIRAKCFTFSITERETSLLSVCRAHRVVQRPQLIPCSLQQPIR